MGVQLLKNREDKHLVEKKQKSASQKLHNLHDEFFKKIFKTPKYLMELLRIIFPLKFVAALDATSLAIMDSTLLRLGGGEMRTDLTASARLRGTDMAVTITFILEHKSYRDPDMFLQTMEYYLCARREQLKHRSRKKGAAHNLIIPVVLICCEDKDFEPPSDDLLLEFGDKKIPPVLREFRDLFPRMPCLALNLRKLPFDELWEKERQKGDAPASKVPGVSGTAITAVQGMAEVWDADDDTVAALLTKGRLLSPEDGAFILENLNVYYVSADNAIAEGDFNRIDRQRWPDLAQEERLEAMLETQSDRAERLGIKRGIEQGKLEMVKRFLQAGVEEQTICRAAQLSKQELAKIKRSLG